ncbi:regulatory protein RecX [uncultured Porphyromonas sp.]|uniref:regulatory protein RecX n=1 Tax=uncultured Porphyromonas sp. TaxID=159274 RepID=UPI00262F79C0|nr:regulatory protein RecX [uncultured Porphyromonas sp.]
MEAEALKELLIKAGRYTSKYEKTSKEVVEKLLTWSDGEIRPSEIEQIIDQLKSEKFIDEERYAERYVRDKLVMLKKGPILIRYELKERGVPSALIQKALNAVPYDDWFSALKEYLMPKLARYKSKAKNEYDLRMKLIDAAYRRGYPSDVYEEVIDGLEL